MTTSIADWQPSLAELQAIRQASAQTVKSTPVSSSASLSRLCGSPVVLKLENLQRTGSFKLRGAMSRLYAARGARGVVAGSAGNHGQAIAYAARMNNLRCVVFMPPSAAVSKVEAVTAFGAEVRFAGDSVDDCVESARALAEQEELLFVHPFDDLEVIKGQAGLGLELIEQVSDLGTVVVPVGGGGLIGGISAALAATGAAVRVVGVQAAGCAPFAASLTTGATKDLAPASTIADGIAIKRPGKLTLALAERWVDEMVTVEDDAIAEAMVLLAERGKLVVEGAGAAAVAALLSGAVAPAPQGSTVAVLSGGNVDMHVFARIVNRHQTEVGRRMRVFTRVADRPGGLASFLQAVAAGGGNVLDLTHVRDGVALDLGETGVEIVMESRDAAHREELISGLERAGYTLEALD